MRIVGWRRHWPKLLILTGAAILIFDLLIDPLQLGLSQAFGLRQARLAVLASILLQSGILLECFIGLRRVCERAWQRFERWLYSDRDAGKHAWMTAAGLALLLFALFLVFFYKRYDYIDDPPIRDSIKANVALLFCANLLRQVLHFLYQLFPAGPWYGIALYVAMVCTLIVVFYLVLTHPMPWGARIVYAGLLVSMYIPFWVRASYNYASSLPGGVAILAFYDSWRNKQQLSVWRSFLWGMLLLVSFVFRRDGPKVAWLFIAPPVLAFLAFQIWTRRPGFRRLLFYAACWVAFLLPYGAIQVFDEYQYQTVLTWQEQAHRSANRSRSAYYGQPRLLAAILDDTALLKANGWNSNDVMIAEYGMVLFDENKFAPERFYRIFDAETGLPQTESRQGVAGAWYNLTHFGQEEGFVWYNPGWLKWNEQWPYTPYYVAMLTLVVFVVWRGRRYSDKLFAPAFLVYVYFASTYMLNYVRLPRHVAVPPLALFYLAMLLCPSLDFSGLARGWQRKILLLLVSAGLLLSFAGFVQFNYRSDQEIPLKRARFMELYRDMAERFGPDAFIFARPPLYIDYFVDPLGDQGPANHLSYLNISSIAYSPLYYRLLNSKGLDYGYQLLPWMVDNPQAYLVGDRPVLLEWVRRFAYETFGLEIEMTPVYAYANGPVVYRLDSVAPSVPGFVVTDDLGDQLGRAEVAAPESKQVQKGRLTIDGRSREVLFQYPPSQVRYELFIPPLGSLRFGIAMAPETWQTSTPVGDGVTFRVLVEKDGRREQVFERYIDPKTRPEDQHWLDFDVKLTQWAGQEVALILETDAGENHNSLQDWALWAEPQVGEWSDYSFTQKFYLGSPAPQRLDWLGVRRVKVAGSYRDAIFACPGQELHFRVPIAADMRLNFQTGLSPQTPGDGAGGVEFRLSVAPEGTNYEMLFTKRVTLARNEWALETVDLSRYAGKTIEFAFTTLGEPAGAATCDELGPYWVAPRLVRSAAQTAP